MEKLAADLAKLTTEQLRALYRMAKPKKMRLFKDPRAMIVLRGVYTERLKKEADIKGETKP